MPVPPSFARHIEMKREAQAVPNSRPQKHLRFDLKQFKNIGK
jgi:hypothetical protein